VEFGLGAYAANVTNQLQMQRAHEYCEWGNTQEWLTPSLKPVNVLQRTNSTGNQSTSTFIHPLITRLICNEVTCDTLIMLF